MIPIEELKQGHPERHQKPVRLLMIPIEELKLISEAAKVMTDQLLMIPIEELKHNLVPNCRYAMGNF